MKLYPKKNIAVHLEELGAGIPRKKRRGISIYHCDICWPCRLMLCLLKWISCFPCAIVLKILRLLGRGAEKGLDVTAGAMGASRAIGKSGNLKWGKQLRESSNNSGESGNMGCELRFKVYPTDKEGQGFFFERPSPQVARMSIQWRPHPFFEGKPLDEVTLKGTAAQKYYPVSTRDMLATEGLNNAIELLQDSYASNPVDPRGLSSWQPPPIKKVVAIYGINLPTEAGGVYKRKRCVKLSYCASDLSVRQLLVLDTKARLNGLEGHTIDGGIIREINVTGRNREMELYHIGVYSIIKLGKGKV